MKEANLLALAAWPVPLCMLRQSDWNLSSDFRTKLTASVRNTIHGYLRSDLLVTVVRIHPDFYIFCQVYFEYFYF